MEIVLAAGVTGLLTLVGGYLALRKEAKAESAADWAKFTEAQKAWTEARLAERDSMIDDLRVRMNDLEKRVAEITEKYAAARHYIIALWQDVEVSSKPPSVIASDLPAPPWSE